MVMKIQIISSEIIKPSSPTPHHLRNLKLSFLDQIAPPIYVPIILFYHAAEGDLNVDHFEISCSLKKSLAETLTRFYPLAGTIKEDFSVDCNDEGVEFTEARVNGKLSDVIEKPMGGVHNQFLPFEPHGKGSGHGREGLLAVQLNIFDCGGAAIGVCVSHKIGDGTSAATFVEAWAATARGASEAIHPSFDGASHFPQREILRYMPDAMITRDKIITRRFVLEKSSIDALRKKASLADGSQVLKLPTRVEAVSAFFWGRIIEISRSKAVPPKVFGAVHAVNLRDRMVPPLPKHSFGNLWQVAIAPFIADNERDYHILVGRLRNGIQEINCDYVKKLQSGDGSYLDSITKGSEKVTKGEVEMCNFTSWCRFPVYETDFGWGKPTWVCSPNRPYKNLVILMSTRGGDGIEAWVNLLEEDMAIFECDPELLSFVSSTK